MMHVLWLASFCLGLLLDRSAADEGLLRALTKDTFGAAVKDAGRALVFFYAPYSGPSKMLAPELELVQQALTEKGLTTLMARVDGTVEDWLRTEYKVDPSEYPKLLYFVRGEPTEYKGAKDKESIVRYLENRERPPVQELDDTEAEYFLEEAEEDEFRVLATVKRKSVRAYAYFDAISNFLLEIDGLNLKFAVRWLAKDADAKADATLQIYRSSFTGKDEKLLNYPNPWTDGNIAKWLVRATFATVAFDFNATRHTPGKAAMKMIGASTAVVAVLDDPGSGVEHDPDLADESDASSDAPTVAEVQKEMLPLTTEYPTWRFHILQTSQANSDAKKLLEVHSGENKVVVLRGDKKFVLRGDNAFVPGALATFLKSVKDGKAKPYYRSQPASARREDEDGVQVLTGNTYPGVTMDPTWNVLVFYDREGCNSCAQFKPLFKELAVRAKKGVVLQGEGQPNRLLRTGDGFLLASMDVNKNDCEGCDEIAGPGKPNLVLFPSTTKNKKKYSGRRAFTGEPSLDAILDFLSSNAKNLKDVPADKIPRPGPADFAKLHKPEL